MMAPAFEIDYDKLAQDFANAHSTNKRKTNYIGLDEESGEDVGCSEPPLTGIGSVWIYRVKDIYVYKHIYVRTRKW